MSEQERAELGRRISLLARSAAKRPDGREEVRLTRSRFELLVGTIAEAADIAAASAHRQAHELVKAALEPVYELLLDRAHGTKSAIEAIGALADIVIRDAATSNAAAKAAQRQIAELRLRVAALEREFEITEANE